eukprot:scaffold61217_cov21-Tisochrysis_lutea.AAC.3
MANSAVLSCIAQRTAPRHAAGRMTLTVPPRCDQRHSASGAGDDNVSECVLCGIGGSLVCCDGCPAAYHSRCLTDTSTARNAATQEWLCPECSVGGRGGCGGSPTEFCGGPKKKAAVLRIALCVEPGGHFTRASLPEKTLPPHPHWLDPCALQALQPRALLDFSQGLLHFKCYVVSVQCLHLIESERLHVWTKQCSWP